MARTFVRQETQIRRSDLYNDAIAPTEAAFETNPVNIEDDLNNLRSQVHNAIKVQGGNWFDDLAVPGTFTGEGEAKRGVDGVNSDLHELERKRALAEILVHTDITVGVSATGILTLSANVSNLDTVSIGSKTYTFQTALTDVDGNVLIGASASDSIDNLIAAINLDAGAGSLYAASTTINPDAYAAPGAGDTMDVTAVEGGAGGNTVGTTETSATASFGGATLSGGSDTANYAILSPIQLPTNTTAALGAVTTLGAVIAAHGGTFGTHSLTEVAGSTDVRPKNLCAVVDSATHDPILSGGRTIYALLQAESGVSDGTTLTGTTATRAQISFVRLNAGGTALEAVPTGDIGGQTIHYEYRERKALDDLTEEDFLSGKIIDFPASTTATRQTGYDAQGTTPVDLLTNATLDLEGAGVAWSIRDDLEADLFEIVEGSAGGTSQFNVHAAVDEYDNDAAVVDFASGATIGSGNTRPITVGVNDGLIETTAGDLEVKSFAELILNDANMVAEGTWAGPGVKVSDTTTEVSDYETAFGGEVSLMNAIVQAYNNSARAAKIYANVTVAAAADIDIGGSGGGANLDAQLPDMSGGSFLTDYDVFWNGELMRPGADASANNDYYPGTSLVLGQIKLEFKAKVDDVVAVIAYA